MNSFARGAGVAIVLAICAPAPLVRAQDILSLRISNETAPPGGIAQVKVFLTEPKPIITGIAQMSFPSFGDIEGIALPSDEAVGVAVVHEGSISLSVVSLDTDEDIFGLDPEYPVVTVAVRVPPEVPLGTSIPVTMDPAALQFVAPTGAVYLAEVKDGSVIVAHNLSMGDIIPGSAKLPAGAVVSILGSGFQPDTRVRFKETLLAQGLYIDPGRIDVVLAEPAHMHGMRIRAKNRDGAEATYYSYQRTRRHSVSAHPVLGKAVPLFPSTVVRGATVYLAATTAGLALQNLEGTDTVVRGELTTPLGVVTEWITVPSNRYVVSSISEMFGLPSSEGSVTFAASAPFQVLGVDVDASGAATPRLPE